MKLEIKKPWQDKTEDERMACRRRLLYAAPILFLLVFVLIRTAWISDDAAIAFRTVDNFLNGYGLTWNVSERVQTYTNPLMVLCMIVICFFTGEYYLTAMLFNMVTTLAAVCILIFGIARGEVRRYLAPTALLICSKAFIDYATSGLENALLYLILAVFFWYYLKHETFSGRQLFLLAFFGGLAVLTRMDSVLLVFPACFDAYFLKSDGKWYKNIWIGAAGISPFLLWELFSLVYYGFLFPNTAYAKLNNGIPAIEYFYQGVLYHLNFITRDPMGFLAIAAAFGLTILVVRGRKLVCISLGMLLYGIYILRIGGDHMSGRFFAVVVFMAAIVLSYAGDLKAPDRCYLSCAAAILAVTLFLPYNNLLSGSDYEGYEETETHIADERAFYYPKTGLLNAEVYNGKLVMNTTSWLSEGVNARLSGAKVTTQGGIGFYGLAAGPDVHVLDTYALGDALLARLPTIYSAKWIVGHYTRVVPDGYWETLETGVNMIEDPDLAAYYDVLHNIISGDIFTVERFKQIIKMNLGMYDDLIDETKYSHKAEAEMTLEDFQEAVTAGSSWYEAWVLSEDGTTISLGETHYEQNISFYATSDDQFYVFILRGGEIVHRESVGVSTGEAAEQGGLQLREFTLSEEIAAAGYDAIEIIPYSGGDGGYGAGYLQLY